MLRERFACEGRVKVSRARKGRQADSRCHRCQLEAGSPLGPNAYGWVSHLNGHDLAGWYSMLQKSGKGVAEKRDMVVMEEGMLHIMGNEIGKEPAEPGYLATNQEFENLPIRLELTGI